MCAKEIPGSSMKMFFRGRMVYLSLISMLFHMIFLSSCSQHLLSSSSTEIPGYPGMVKVPANGKSFVQGASNANAQQDEKPVMRVSFTYDYSIDSSEVTQKEFTAVMGRNPAIDTIDVGIGDEYPVYNVTWYDAVLFCNAKSKIRSIDTAYSYQNVQFSTGGRTVGITGLQANYMSDGYRLPTESEWEFAAREGSSALYFTDARDSIAAMDQAWYSANSNGKSHPVKLKQPNNLGIYDMAGNVYEWTNDWKGFYNSIPITNSIGAAGPNADFEKVLKGGSYMNGYTGLRPTRRSATYPTIPSSGTNYVGFRCVRGKIPMPSYITSDTSQVAPNPVVMVAPSIEEFLGTARAKLVFVNVTGDARTLCILDYNQQHPWVYEYADDKYVYMPTISPDGQFAAYCSRDEGFSGSAIIWVRSLAALNSPRVRLPADSAYVPRWWVDPASPADTFIVYTNSSIDDQTTGWNSTKTFKQKMTGGIPSGAPIVFISDGSFHDGISKNGRYICTGFTKGIMRNLVNSQQATLFQSPGNGKPSNVYSQVCNMSISPDTVHPDRCLLLDFGCPVVNSLTGDAYGVHGYIFMVDYTGATDAWYKCPAGESSWEFLQWSTHPDFAVSCCADAAGNVASIYLVPLKAPSIPVKLINGVTLANPFLWCDCATMSASGLDPDSLGQYDTPTTDWQTKNLSTRLHDFWLYYREFRGVFVGSSHTVGAIDRKSFKTSGIFNMGVISSQLQDYLDILRNYVLIRCDSLKVVGMEVTPAFLTGRVFMTQIQKTKGYRYDKNHDFWETGLPPGFSQLVNQASWDQQTGWLDTLGCCTLACSNGWGGANPPVEFAANGKEPLSWDTSVAEYQANLADIKQLAKDLEARKIHLLMFITPESPYYKTMDTYGRYGPNRATAAAIIHDFQSIVESSNGYCHFYDANKGGNHDYVDSDACDYDHLGPIGAVKFSTRVDSILATFLH
jgi:uncharacterized protein (TIGR02171 family)